MTHTLRAAVLLLMSSVLLVTQTRAEDVLTLTGDPWPPYVIGTEGSPDAEGGLGVDLIRNLFDRIDGVSVRFPLMPWKRALKEVELGRYDGICLLLRTSERESYMAFSEPLLASRSLIWYRRERFSDGFKWDRFQDLLSYHVGAIRGYSYGPQMDEAIAEGKVRVTKVSSLRQLFQMLARGRVDLVFANDAVGLAMAERFAAEAEIVAAHKPTGEDVYHIGFSRKSGAARWLPQVNAAIAEMQDDGTIARTVSAFFKKHGMKMDSE